MRTSKINYFIVGIFVIAAIVGLIGSVALLTGRTGASDRYLAYYSNVTGVKFGTQVVYEGYPIGQVTEIVPEEKDGRMRFRIDFDINKGWKIPVDSSVEIAAPGLLAAVTLSISAGKSAAALTPGSVLKSRERSDIFAAVSGVAGDFSELTRDHLKPLLTNVDNTVTAIGEFLQIGGEGRMIAADARDTMSLARDIMRELQQRVPGITSKLDGILGDVGTTSRRLSDILTEDNRDKIVGMIDHMNAATQKIRRRPGQSQWDTHRHERHHVRCRRRCRPYRQGESLYRRIGGPPRRLNQSEHGRGGQKSLRIQPPDSPEPGPVARRQVAG
ncbi:MAG: MlaD family protein [Proteobacteria bacterium]|nr:MlaD family protein [Pseudomonadota bacterium]